MNTNQPDKKMFVCWFDSSLMERAGLMSYTAAGHQGAIETLLACLSSDVLSTVEEEEEEERKTRRGIQKRS